MRKILLLFLLFLFINNSSLFSETPVPPAEYTSSRTKGFLVNPDGGITINGGFGALSPYTISWTIQNTGGNNFNYLYSLDPLTDISTPDQGDVFFELGTGFSRSLITNVLINSIPLANLSDVSVSDFNIQGVQGLLFDSTGQTLISTVQFDIPAGPMYGDFQHGITDAVGTARNTGFGTDPSSPYIDWVAVPGISQTIPIPEPSTYLILGSAMLIAIVIKSKRRYTRMV